jgi:hypothetical protein
VHSGEAVLAIARLVVIALSLMPTNRARAAAGPRSHGPLNSVERFAELPHAASARHVSAVPARQVSARSGYRRCTSGRLPLR